MYGWSTVCTIVIRDDDVLDDVRTCQELGWIPAVEGVVLQQVGLCASLPPQS